MKFHHVKTPKVFGVVASLSAFFVTQPLSPLRAQSNTPPNKPNASAPQQTRPVRTTTAGPTRDVSVPIIIQDGWFFRIPSFSVLDAKIAHSFGGDVQMNESKPLLDPQGTLNAPTGDGNSAIIITLWGSEGVENLKNELKTKIEADAVLNNIKYAADLQNNNSNVLPIVARLEASDLRSPDGFILLAQRPLRFDDGTTEVQLNFEVPNSILQRGLVGARNGLVLRIQSTYDALFFKQDYELTASALQSNVSNTLSSVVSNPGDKKVLFIPIGGNADGKSTWKQLLSQSIKVQITTFEGGQRPQGDLVDTFIDRMLNTLLQQVSLANEQDSTILTFLMSNGVSVQTTIGEIKNGRDELFTEMLNQSEDIVRAATEQQKNLNFGAAGKAVIEAVPVAGSFFFKKESANSDQREEIHRQFRRDVNHLKQEFEGGMPIVAGMTLSQMQEFEKQRRFEAVVTEVTEARTGQKTYQVSLPLRSQNVTQDAARRAETIFQRLQTWVGDPNFLNPEVINRVLVTEELTPTFRDQILANPMLLRQQIVMLTNLAATIGRRNILNITGRTASRRRTHSAWFQNGKAIQCSLCTQSTRPISWLARRYTYLNGS